jgi:hypothetical protein
VAKEWLLRDKYARGTFPVPSLFVVSVEFGETKLEKIDRNVILQSIHFHHMCWHVDMSSYMQPSMSPFLTLMDILWITGNTILVEMWSGRLAHLANTIMDQIIVFSNHWAFVITLKMNRFFKAFIFTLANIEDIQYCHYKNIENIS